MVWSMQEMKARTRKIMEAERKHTDIRTALEHFNLCSEMPKKKDKREMLLTLKKKKKCATYWHNTSYCHIMVMMYKKYLLSKSTFFLPNKLFPK